jgi:hypothetical protein
MSSNSNPVVNSCCTLVYTSLCLIFKSELISTKSFRQKRLRSQNSAGNWEHCSMTTCTLNFGFYGKVRGANLCCPVSTKIPPIPLRELFKKTRQTRESIIQYIHILKIICMKSYHAWVLWAHAHQPCAQDARDSKALSITLHRAPCDRPWTAHKERNLSYSSEIFPAARDTEDKWPFWYSIASLRRTQFYAKLPY